MSRDNDLLTEIGLQPKGHGRVLVIACGALAREILAITKAGQLSHIDLTCLPAILHNHPKDITGAVIAAVEKHQPNYEKLFVAYADCGTGGHLQAACARLGVEMIAGPHCYSFYEGNAAFAARDEITAFYLTDFLARQFEAFIWKPLGLEKHPELLEMYFGNYQKLVFQSQTEDPDLLAKARLCATQLGLEFEHRPTGYGDLQKAIEALD